MGIFPGIGDWSAQTLHNWITDRFPQLAALQTPTVVTRTTIPGEMRMWATGTAPAGFLLCDGTAYDSGDDTYSSLHGVLGTTFNTGGESAGFFRVPDLRGRAPIGAGTHADVNALGDSDGLVVGARTPKHSHHKSAFDTQITEDVVGSDQPAAAGVDWNGVAFTPYSAHVHAVSAFDTDSFDFPRLVVNFIIAL